MSRRPERVTRFAGTPPGPEPELPVEPFPPNVWREMLSHMRPGSHCRMIIDIRDGRVDLLTIERKIKPRHVA